MPSDEGAFFKLPMELFLLVLDALVDCSLPPQQPVAFPPSHPTTKALLALTRVSRAVYPLASRYLYANCCYVNATNFKRIHRTLGLHFGPYSQDTRPDYKEALWKQADVLRYMNRAYFSAWGKSPNDIVDLLLTIGTHLKTLVLNISTLYGKRLWAEAPQLTADTSLGSSNVSPVCLSMPLLEELVVSFNITKLMPTPPPYLQRLCITTLKHEDVLSDFHNLIPSLKVVMVPGFMGFTPTHIDSWDHRGREIDYVIVNVSVSHQVPTEPYRWKEEKKVRVWEIDVPTSFYGDDPDSLLCDSWIWDHALAGTLWEAEKRRVR